MKHDILVNKEVENLISQFRMHNNSKYAVSIPCGLEPLNNNNANLPTFSKNFREDSFDRSNSGNIEKTRIATQYFQLV
jgi:hypothetical protein